MCVERQKTKRGSGLQELLPSGRTPELTTNTKARGVLAPLIMRPTSRMGNDPSCLPLREGPTPPHPTANHQSTTDYGGWASSFPSSKLMSSTIQHWESKSVCGHELITILMSHYKLGMMPIPRSSLHHITTVVRADGG